MHNTSYKGEFDVKTINVKIPIRTVEELDSRGQLNPQFIGGLLTNLIAYRQQGVELNSEVPVGKLTYYYALKIDDLTHSHFKDYAKEEGLALSELTGRLFNLYYWGGEEWL